VGLDTVEFVLATEEAFQIAIPDSDAEKLLTPADVVDYVLARVGLGPESACLEQRAFYRLRHASMRLFRAERSAIEPGTRWESVLPTRDRRHNWRLLHQATGTPQWPRLTLLGKLPTAVETVGGTARYLATEATAALKGGTAWSREEVETTVRRLMKEQLGVTSFQWDQQFVKDLGVD
jgi:hypothetical protein